MGRLVQHQQLAHQRRQIQQRAVDFPCIPGTESVGLVNFNVNENGNDLQLLATYSADDISAVLAAARTGP